MLNGFFKRPNKKFLIAAALIPLLFGFYLNYSQKSVSAQEALTKKYFPCKQEIPIGETIEDTSKLLGSLTNEIRLANLAADSEIFSASEMIKLAEQCDINKCHPVCSPEAIEPGFKCNPVILQVPCPPPPPSSLNIQNHYASLVQASAPSACYKTFWSICHLVKCRQEKCSGQVCPNEQINNEFNNVQTSFNRIKGLPERISKIYKDNKPKVKKNLNEARGEFNECAFSNRKTIICPVVEEKNLSQKKGRCKSEFNFFCCQ